MEGAGVADDSVLLVDRWLTSAHESVGVSRDRRQGVLRMASGIDSLPAAAQSALRPEQSDKLVKIGVNARSVKCCRWRDRGLLSASSGHDGALGVSNRQSDSLSRPIRTDQAVGTQRMTAPGRGDRLFSTPMHSAQLCVVRCLITSPRRAESCA